jgi:hypothetical protein
MRAARLIEPTLRRRGMKPRKGYADGGAPDDDAVPYRPFANSPITPPDAENDPDMPQPLFTSAQSWPGSAIGNKAADIGSRFVGEQAQGLANMLAAPGALAKPNPYEPGSEEYDWYEGQREQASADWGAGTGFALTTGATGMPAEPNTLRMGASSKFKAAANKIHSDYGKDVDRVFYGYNSALDQKPLQEAQSPYVPPTTSLSDEVDALWELLAKKLGTPAEKQIGAKIDQLSAQKKAQMTPVDIWSVDPSTLSPGQLVKAGPNGNIGTFNGVTKAGTVMVNWKKGAPGNDLAAAAVDVASKLNDSPTPAEPAAPPHPALDDDPTEKAMALIKKALDEPGQQEEWQPWQPKQQNGPSAVPPWVEENEVLPEDERQAARLAGGYTTPAVRGMRILPGQDFDPSHELYGSPFLGEGHYSSNSPELADMYAGYLSDWPGANPKELDFPEGASGVPLWINTKDYLVADAGGKMWTKFNASAIKEARQAGHKGVVIHNVWDEPNSTQALNGPKTVYITFPEGLSTVKSKFASQFNALSPNMTKALLAAAGTGAMIRAVTPSQSKAAPIGKAGGGALANPFDEFDAAPAAQSANPFDEFDAPNVSTGTDIAKSAGVGLGQGMIDFAGLPATGANLLNKGVNAATNYITGKFGMPATEAPQIQHLTPQGIQKGVEKLIGKFYEPKTTYGKYAREIGEQLGNPLTYTGEGAIGTKLLAGIAAGAGSEALGEAAEGTELEPYARTIGAIGAGGMAHAAGREAENIGRVAAPSTEDIHFASQQNYNAMKGFGVEFRPHVAGQMYTNILNELYAEGYRPNIAPRTFSAIEELLTPAGRYHDVSDIDSVRKVLNRVAGIPEESDAARRAIGQIDDSMAQLTPRDAVINGQFIPRVVEQAQEARGNYAAYKHAQQAEEATSNAALQAASTGSGANIDNATRQKFRAILTSPKKRRGFTDDELTQMGQIVNGTFMGDAARLVGKLAPTGVVSGGMSAALGHALGHTLLPAGIGMGAKMVSDAATRRAAARLSEQIRLRSPLAQRMGSSPLQRQVGPVEGLTNAALRHGTEPTRPFANNPITP